MSNIRDLTVDEHITLAFDLILSAATMLSAFPYADAAEALRRHEAGAWLTDPTAMQSVDAGDLLLKLRLLDAAAAFAREWESVKTDALNALTENDDD